MCLDCPAPGFARVLCSGRTEGSKEGVVVPGAVVGDSRYSSTYRVPTRRFLLRVCSYWAWSSQRICRVQGAGQGLGTL